MLGIIHIGAEKTGTTTLQEAFHLNRGRLAKAGIAFPRVPGAKQHGLLAFYAMDDARRNLQTRSLPDSWTGDRDRWRIRFSEELAREIAGLSGDRLLISTELLHTQVRTEEEVARLKSLLDAWCDRYRIVFYMRRQDRAKVSRYSTDLRTGGTLGSPLAMRVPNPWLFDYESILDLWSGVFGRDSIVPRVFSRATLRDGDIVSDFMDAMALPLDLPAMARPPRRNSSLSGKAQQFLLAYNRSVAGTPQNPDGGRLQRILAQAVEAACPGPPALPSRDQAMAFYERYRAGNARIAAQWFGGRQLFDDDFDDYPADPESATLGAADAISIAAHVLRDVTANSLWLDEARLQRLLGASTPTLLQTLADFTAERSPELAARITATRMPGQNNDE